MAREDACAGSVTNENPAPAAEQEQEPAVAPDAAVAGNGPPLRIPALHLMLFGATAIIGAAAVPVPPPRLFLAFLAWLVGCLSLFMPRA
ncbi:hypothetical protein U9M48_021761 [Paspalum notatum var. saurae]|uniref:Uncharacterized protein n=1 Tax=Paspalum notatum var. saurae TaxID=547442 RepID=A0AAQ3TID2_PASNO